jgi:hypothetical protein
MRALEKHPDARYQSAYDLADDLEAFLRDAQMHSGPVRIARYLDALSQAAGGPGRPELVSEAEVRGTGPGELDGGRSASDSYAPGAAKEWEDTEQPEADVAAALGLDVAELRALRTPVPLPPAGSLAEGEADATTPVARVSEEAIERPGAEEDVPTLSTPAPPMTGPPPAPTGPPPAMTGPPPAMTGPPPAPMAPMAPLAVPVPVPIPVPMAAPVGGSVLERGRPMAMMSPRGGPAGDAAPPPSLGQRLPWILVGALGVAVAALVAYIVIGA